jgi:outer membrane cobalamin receptor
MFFFSEKANIEFTFMLQSRAFWFFLFLVNSIQFGQAESILIKGNIRDLESNESIRGASIMNNQNPENVVYSGLNGNFQILVNAIPCVILIKKIGYQIIEVDIQSADQFTLVTLIPEYLSFSQIAIMVNTKGKSDQSARSLERISGNQLNIVSSKTIETSPDLTVANVIQRVSGVVVERNNTGDGQYVILRGMDKRYSYTLVNGVKIPSPDNKNRYVPLDIFPAELLDYLKVSKTLTPEMEADAVGGAIDLIMKDAPHKRQFKVNFSTGFNSIFLNRDFASFDRSDINFESPHQLYGAGYPARVADFTKSNLIVRNSTVAPNFLGGVTYGDRWFNKKIGFIFAANFQNSYRGSKSMLFSHGIATNEASNLPIITSRNDRHYSEQQSRLGVHLKLDYQLTKTDKIDWYNAVMDFNTSQVRETNSTDFSLAYDPVNGNYSRSVGTRLRFNHQRIFNSTLKGSHTFKYFNLDWSGVYSGALNETPDNAFVYLGTRVNNNVPNPLSVVSSSGGSGGIKRRWENNTDKDLAFYLNVKHVINVNSGIVEFSTGGLYRNKVRSSFFDLYNFNPFDPQKGPGLQNNLIYGIDWVTYDQIKLSIENPRGSTGDPLNYDASEQIAATYVQGKYESRRFQLIAGVRLEHTNQGYVLKNPTVGVTNDSSQVYWELFPSVNLKYKIKNNANLRASFYTSINRPNFFEIVPYRIINEEFQERGNPNLKYTIARNADLRYELFPKPAEQFMVGVFYKQILNPIEVGIFTQGQNTYFMPDNFGTAENFGFEIDFIKYFNWLGVKANYTFTHSEIATIKVKNIENPDPNAADRVKQITVMQIRPLNNQAMHVFNFSLLVKKADWDGQIAVSYSGERINAISRFEDNDIWESGFVQLDASLEKSFRNGFVIFAKAVNLLNSPMTHFIKQSNATNVENGKTNKGYEIIRQDSYGYTNQLGFRYKF